MPHTPLTGLRVLEIEYAGKRPVPRNHWAFDSYQADAYPRAKARIQVLSPRAPTYEPETDSEVIQALQNGAIADATAQGLYRGQAICMTGGNCNHVTGIVGGLQDVYGAGARIGLVWFDAHGDFNTPQTSLTGSMGGMPVAVCAGLAFPTWREGSHIAAPLPTDRIALVDVRNLDPAEETLIRAVGVPIAAPAPGFPGEELGAVVEALASRVDLIYCHIDADILDGTLQPNHSTIEFDGPSLEQTLDAVELVMATGKVAAFAVVSVFTQGVGADIAIRSGTDLIGGGLALWHKYGTGL